MTARALLVLVVLAGNADNNTRAEPEREPKPLRLVVLAAGAILHFVTDYVIEDRLAPDQCRWCAPPGFDATLREHVVWDDRKRAARLSDATGFVAIPLVTAGLFALAAREARCPGRRLFHDAIPIVESAVYTQLFAQGLKYSFGRQRPAIRFDGTGGAPSSEDNLSFISGRTALAFSVAVSGGIVARRRGYAIAPAILIPTLALATATAYFRMAGDRHYLSDVIAGALVGSTGGYLIPYFGTKLGERAVLVPAPNGVSIAGLL